MQFAPFLDVTFGGSMRQSLRFGNSNAKSTQQIASIPFLYDIGVHIVRFVLTGPHSESDVCIAELHFRLNDNLSRHFSPETPGMGIKLSNLIRLAE
jgi:hypothetical protein